MQLNSKTIKKISLLIFLAGSAAWLISQRGQIDLEALETWVRTTGPMGPLLYVLVFALAIVLLMPASLFILLGGALFGPLFGTLYSILGATIGAALAFLIARYIAADWIARKSQGRFKQLVDGVESEGWHFVAFTRLVPLFPFFLLSYAFGLTRIRIYPYIIATAICSMPSIAGLTYLGYVGKEALAGGDALVQKLLIALGVLAVLAYLPRFVKRLHDQGKL